jgi:outer membrane protein assembly factor BamC
MRILLALAVLLLSGCSLMPDRYRDRAMDYLKTTEQPQTQSLTEQRLAFSDRYVIPTLAVTPERPDSFKAPMPQPLLAEPEEEGAASLNALRSEALDPQIEHDGAGGLILRMNGSFAQAWSLTTDAIAATKLNLTDLNRSTGTWYLSMKKTIKASDGGWWARLWGKDKTVDHTYLLKMSRTRTGVYLSLLEDDDSLADEPRAQAVFAELKAWLDKQK